MNRTPDELSRRLRELRGEMRQIDAARASGISQPAITRFESGRQVPRPEQVQALCDAYVGTPAKDRRELMALAKELRARQRRVVLSKNHTAVQERIKREQEEATLIRSFSPSGIAGLLQTAGYIGIIFGDSKGGDVRLKGQAILGDPAKEFAFLIPEGSLGWALMPPEDMAAQIDHIAAVAQRPNVRVGIIPWGRPAEVLPINSWEMYDERLVRTGTNTGSSLLVEEVDVAPYLQLFTEIEALAEFGDEAREILARVADRYRSL